MGKILVVAALVVVAVSIYLGGVNRFREDEKTEEAASSPVVEVQVPSGWQSYSNKELGFSLSYPTGFLADENGSDSIQIMKQTDEPGAGPANFIYVSVVPQNEQLEVGQIYNYNKQHFDILNSLEIGESASTAGGSGQDEWFTYERVEDSIIGGVSARSFINRKPWEFPNGTTEYFNYFEKDTTLYIVGGYVGAESSPNYHISEELFEQIVATFKTL